jgi:hypothetical protein
MGKSGGECSRHYTDGDNYNVIIAGTCLRPKRQLPR